MTRTRTRIAAAVLATAGLATVGAGAAQAAQDTSCMQAGIATLKSAGLLQTVAKNGITVGQAVAVGVTLRDPSNPSGITADTVIPFSMLLADHRAGDNSTFVYPWCEG